MGITIRRNSKYVKLDPFYGFNKTDGYFGCHKPGNMQNVRTIYTNGDPSEEAKKLFAQFTSGGKITEKINGRFWTCELDDGTSVSLRIDYPPGHAPAVQISMRKSKDPAGIVSQKIHFEKKGN